MQENQDAILRQFEASQWWPNDVMARHQAEQLGELLAHARRTVPFYRDRLADAEEVLRAGTGGSDGTDSTFADSEEWLSTPLLSREDIQAAGDALHSTDVPAAHGNIAQHWTGGSTGRPVMVLGTGLTELYWRACTVREHLWHERDFDQKMAVIRYVPGRAADPPDGMTATNWGPATAGYVQTGPVAVLSTGSTCDEQAAWLARSGPAYLQTYPSVAAALARYCLDDGMRLEGLREVRTFGEVVDPSAHELCRSAWNVPLVDLYSTQEVGYVALACPESESYHVQSEHLLVEILDSEGRPCTQGEVGRVVVTTLYNFAMPLVRYDIGDYAEAGGPCSCGRNLPTLARILGRQRNMFILPDGRLRWPAVEIDPTQAFDGDWPIRQFQVIQRTRTALEVKLVATRRLSEVEQSGLRAQVGGWFGYPFEVNFIYVDEIPRSPSGKFEDFRCVVRLGNP